MLSRNLKKKNYLSTKAKQAQAIKKFVLLVAVAIPVTYGIMNLMRLSPKESKKEDLSVEMGDRPVEKTIKIMIKADGGLNMRKEPNVGSEKIGKIPDGTKLEAKKELEGWYNIDFDGKNGWISKEFTVLEEEAKPDETSDWLTFTSDAYGFSVKYPRDWTFKDYGMTQGGESLGFVAFSFSELPSSIPQGAPLFVPIEVKLSTKALEELKAPYEGMAQKTVTEVDISGIKGIKYVYADAADSTEKTKIFFSHSGKSYTIAENGGYQEDLDKFLKTFKLR